MWCSVSLFDWLGTCNRILSFIQLLFHWNRKISLDSRLLSLNASTGDDKQEKCDFVDAKFPYFKYGAVYIYRRSVDCGVTFHPILFHSDESKWYVNIIFNY